MLDSLKDLYISYPFMPIEQAPALFSHVKDIRCVIELPAMDPISQVENDNYIRAWLTAIETHTENAANNKVLIVGTASVHISAYSLQIDELIPVYGWENGAPCTNSFMLVDTVINSDSINYELQPDTLLFVQKAPTISICSIDGSTTTMTNPTIVTESGYNVGITKGQNGISVYGAAGVGLGAYHVIPPCYINIVPDYLQGLGAVSINGLYGDVWFKGAHPVDIDTDAIDPETGRYVVKIQNGEV